MTVQTKQQQIREAAEADLEFFINLVAPYRVLGSVHRELIKWWTRQERLSHQLCLLPRDHGKSAMIAYRVAWTIVKRPEVRVLYISATANLAEKQLKMIKDILTSPKVQRYWPELINREDAKREKWSATEICVDHPIRKKEGIRDSTIFTGGLTSSLTGLHCDIAVLDDVVVMENAYTEDGRRKVSEQYALLASIEAADAEEWVVGTRYHPKDLYNSLLSFEEELYDSVGDISGYAPVYETFERQVEDIGDGSGEFLWPRQQRYDGKWYGFDQKILSKKRAKYEDNMTQFRAQYYNDPNNPDGTGIKRELFQYFDRASVKRVEGKWHVRGRPLNVFAAIDFAYTLSRKSDFTAIVVVGIDGEKNIYVLDIARFKTEKIADYYKEIQILYTKWDFRKIRAEVTTAQHAIVKELKDSYFQKYGLPITVDSYLPTRNIGSKQERMRAVLEPKYSNQKIWHYQEGNCQTLEDELVLENPPHDDVKDALANAIEICVPPMTQGSRSRVGSVIEANSRFGGLGGR